MGAAETTNGAAARRRERTTRFMLPSERVAVMSRHATSEPAPAPAQPFKSNDAVREDDRHLSASQKDLPHHREFSSPQPQRRSLVDARLCERLSRRLNAKLPASFPQTLGQGSAVDEPMAKVASTRRHAWRPSGDRSGAFQRVREKSLDYAKSLRRRSVSKKGVIPRPSLKLLGTHGVPRASGQDAAVHPRDHAAAVRRQRRARAPADRHQR